MIWFIYVSRRFSIFHNRQFVLSGASVNFTHTILKPRRDRLVLCIKDKLKHLLIQEIEWRNYSAEDMHSDFILIPLSRELEYFKSGGWLGLDGWGI